MCRNSSAQQNLACNCASDDTTKASGFNPILPGGGGGRGRVHPPMRNFLKFLLNDLRYLNEILQVCSDMYEAYFRH